MQMPPTHLARTKPDATPMAEWLAEELRQEDSLTFGQFDSSDFGERKLWIWAEHDLRRDQVALGMSAKVGT
jgi:hypothetical protein